MTAQSCIKNPSVFQMKPVRADTWVWTENHQEKYAVEKKLEKKKVITFYLDNYFYFIKILLWKYVVNSAKLKYFSELFCLVKLFNMWA